MPRLRLRLTAAWLVVCLFCLTAPAAAATDAEPYLWPIAGARPGEGVLYRPQDVLDREFNFADLFIGAEAGAVVVAPRDAEIASEGYVYRPSLQTMQSFSFGIDEAVDDFAACDREVRASGAEYLAKHMGRPVDARYISYQVGLDCGGGETLYIGGLRPVRFFKTGMKIARGDTLGTVGYVYAGVKEPAICFSRSLRTRAADPMSVFGIASSYLPPEADKIDYLTFAHPAADLQADFAVFRAALEEGHPGLYDYIPAPELDAIFDAIAARLDRPLTSLQFELLLQEAVVAIRDSHTVLYPKRFQAYGNAYPPVLFGLCDSDVTVFSAFPENQDLVGKTITRLDGRDVQELIPPCALLATRSDGFIPSVTELSLMKSMWRDCGRILNLGEGDALDLDFADGTTAHLQYRRLTANIYQPRGKRFSPDEGRFTTRVIDDTTALIDLNTFELLATDEEAIAAFVQAANDSGRTNLIIDVRDNFGGSDEVLVRLFALLADRPFRTEMTSMVRNNDTYALFAHTDNYAPESRHMFPEFTERREGGFYRPAADYVDTPPDPDVHFAGDVYVLVNPRSISAATLLPALVRKFDRGVIIGQETGSCYYRMNGLKFAQVRLEHSGLELRLPLVKMIFDERRRPDIPWGRGVIPDVPLPLVYEFAGMEDQALAKALELIAARKGK